MSQCKQFHVIIPYVSFSFLHGNLMEGTIWLHQMFNIPRKLYMSNVEYATSIDHRNNFTKRRNIGISQRPNLSDRMYADFMCLPFEKRS
jgi:hypothetical protein